MPPSQGFLALQTAPRTSHPVHPTPRSPNVPIFSLSQSGKLDTCHRGRHVCRMLARYCTNNIHQPFPSILRMRRPQCSEPRTNTPPRRASGVRARRFTSHECNTNPQTPARLPMNYTARNERRLSGEHARTDRRVHAYHVSVCSWNPGDGSGRARVCVLLFSAREKLPESESMTLRKREREREHFTWQSYINCCSVHDVCLCFLAAVRFGIYSYFFLCVLFSCCIDNSSPACSGQAEKAEKSRQIQIHRHRGGRPGRRLW